MQSLLAGGKKHFLASGCKQRANYSAFGRSLEMFWIVKHVRLNHWSPGQKIKI